MSLSLRLDLRQSQSLVMTPQLQQAIKLLQLSNLELASYVDGELEQNPLLEPPAGLATAGRAPATMAGPSPVPPTPCPTGLRSVA
jgi:RNA polymerase sigma-54 factor